ncbi:MAG TPA: trypsin-like serine protease [Pseudonocardiaceae bacterium]|jgi:V8-like Glu-specific endopeptidase|nr:trypsin-like serine protease [Pseudonocardiaceae bacterium]
MSRHAAVLLAPLLALTVLGATASVAPPAAGPAPHPVANNTPREYRTSQPQTTAAPPETVASTQDSALPGPPDPVVGALFSTGADGLGKHFCTASVVAAPTGDIVLTAAHCLHRGGGGSYHTGVVFLPGYHDGQAPYGVWTAGALVVDPRWIRDGDPDLDFGFLVVQRNSAGETLQQVTGGDVLGDAAGYDVPVRVTGYPDDTEDPVACDTGTRRAATFQLRFACAGFPAGTSGSPLVTGVDPATGTGTVVGVIGGYQDGGDSADVSYSSYFDTGIQHLFATALANG